MSAEAAVTWLGLEDLLPWGQTLRAGHLCRMVEDFILHQGTLRGAAGASSQHGSWLLPEQVIQGDQARSSNISYDLALEVITVISRASWCFHKQVLIHVGEEKKKESLGPSWMLASTKPSTESVLKPRDSWSQKTWFCHLVGRDPIKGPDSLSIKWNYSFCLVYCNGLWGGPNCIE